MSDRTTNDRVVMTTTLVVGAGPASVGLFLYARAEGVLRDLLSVASEDPVGDSEEVLQKDTVGARSEPEPERAAAGAAPGPAQHDEATHGGASQQATTFAANGNEENTKDPVPRVEDVADPDDKGIVSEFKIVKQKDKSAPAPTEKTSGELSGYATDASWWEDENNVMADDEDDSDGLSEDSTSSAATLARSVSSDRRNSPQRKHRKKYRKSHSNDKCEVHKSGAAWLSSLPALGGAPQSLSGSTSARPKRRRSRERKKRRSKLSVGAQAHKRRSLVWVDSGPTSSFGGGALVSYEICSNTSAARFIKNAHGFGVGGALDPTLAIAKQRRDQNYSEATLSSTGRMSPRARGDPFGGRVSPSVLYSSDGAASSLGQLSSAVHKYDAAGAGPGTLSGSSNSDKSVTQWLEKGGVLDPRWLESGRPCSECIPCGILK